MPTPEVPELVYTMHLPSYSEAADILGPEALLSSTLTTLNAIDNTKQTKEYIDKLEKHIDELEVDIEFFNEERQKQDVKIEVLNDQIIGLVCENTRLTNEIKSLTADIASMHGMLNYYMERIDTLETKLDERNKVPELQ